MASKFSSPDRFPSWKIQTRAPKLAVIETRLMSTALTGRKTDPKVRNRTTGVTAMTMATATGTLARKLSMKSADRAARPVTPTVAPAGSRHLADLGHQAAARLRVGQQADEKMVTLVVSPATV